MKPNMGPLDKAFRLLIAVIIAVLYFSNLISGLAASILLVLCGIFILTSLISFCPLYYPFGFSTRKKIK